MAEEILLAWDEIASRWNPANAGLKKADLISSKAKAEDFIVQSTISLICLRFYDSLSVLISQRKRTQRVRFFNIKSQILFISNYLLTMYVKYDTIVITTDTPRD